MACRVRCMLHCAVSDRAKYADRRIIDLDNSKYELCVSTMNASFYALERWQDTWAVHATCTSCLECTLQNSITSAIHEPILSKHMLV